MGEFIGELIFEVFGEFFINGIFGAFSDSNLSKKTRIALLTVVIAVPAAILGFLTHSDTVRAEADFLVYLFYIIIAILLVIWVLNIYFIYNPPKKIRMRLVAQYEEVIRKAETMADIEHHIKLSEFKGIAFGGTVDEPKLIVKISPSSLLNEKDFTVEVLSEHKGDCFAFFNECDNNSIYVCISKAIKTVEKYYNKKIRFTTEQIEHLYKSEKEEFFDEKTGCWQIMKEEKDDSKFTKFFTFRTKTTVKEYDFRSSVNETR